ncbi:MAG: hypothetical protein IKH99_06045 [Prevotella sp.]|nr:hypothetical protein [Prevotella sp.]
MSLFHQRKPHRFTHHYLYVDERKERLRQIEQRVRKERGKPKAGSLLPQTIVILLLVLVLIVIWNLLLS